MHFLISLHYKSIQNENPDATGDSSFTTYPAPGPSSFAADSSSAHCESVSFSDPVPGPSDESANSADLFAADIHEVDSQEEPFQFPQVTWELSSPSVSLSLSPLSAFS